MPSRIIRESARSSPTLDALSDGAERTFWRLTTAADDYGRFNADPRWVLSACFPLKVGGKLSTSVIANRLNEMGRVGLVLFYAVDEHVYGVFVNAAKYFNRRARVSKYPEPPTEEGACTQMLADAFSLRASDRTCTTRASKCARGTRYRGTEVPRNEVPRYRGVEQISLDEKSVVAFADANGDPAPLDAPNQPPQTPAALRQAGREILGFLNTKTGRSFRPVPEHLKLITARLRSPGVTPALMRAVVAVKCRQWAGDAKMAGFLRPKTLFAATNFESYLGELPRTAFEPEAEGAPEASAP